MEYVNIYLAHGLTKSPEWCLDAGFKKQTTRRKTLFGNALFSKWFQTNRVMCKHLLVQKMALGKHDLVVHIFHFWAERKMFEDRVVLVELEHPLFAGFRIQTRKSSLQQLSSNEHWYKKHQHCMHIWWAAVTAYVPSARFFKGSQKMWDMFWICFEPFFRITMSKNGHTEQNCANAKLSSHFIQWFTAERSFDGWLNCRPTWDGLWSEDIESILICQTM